LPTVRSLFRFHVAGGGRVASRNAIATICTIIIVLGSAPDPLVWLKFLALGVAGAGHDSGPLIGLTLIALALSFEAVPRLTLGLGGWTRSLPATAVQHRRGATYGLPIIQVPLVTSAVLAALLTSLVFRVPLAWPKLLGVPIALVAAGAAAVPAQRWLISIPAFTASALLAAYGRWTTLAAAVALFAVGELLAGGIRFPARRPAVAAPAAPGTMRMFRFTWRAAGLRLLAPLPMPALALAAAWFYSRNNELGPADTAFVARLWSVIAVSLYIGAVGDIVVSRRPSWPWARSLPWSSMTRAIDNAIAIGAPAVPIALLAAVVDLRTTLIAVAALPPLAAFASLLLHGARRRLTRVSGRTILVGTAFATAVAFVPWVVAFALVATPFLLRAAAWRDRREIVTGWKELHHDAAGDSLAWSTR
jgi:hypothetical protein